MFRINLKFAVQGAAAKHVTAITETSKMEHSSLHVLDEARFSTFRRAVRPGLSLESEMSSSTPMPTPPKTSIFDITLAGVPEEPRPRPLFSRLFFREKPAALPGVSADEMPSPASLESWMAASQPNLPRRPKLSIFDQTLPGTSEAMPAPPVEQRPEADSLDFVSTQIETSASTDEVLWDEGTAVEWNPKWKARPGNEVPAGEQESVPPVARPRFAKKLLAAAAIVGLTLGGTVLILKSHTPSPAAPSLRSEVPASLQIYLAKAEAGDAAAMRMVGLRYCYGLEAPLDTTEGTKWLKRASDLGNAAARKELSSMGLR